MEVKISVIMGVYQPVSRQVLFQAVLSIVSQTFQEWELIMVDDGTSGKGRRWIEQAALLDPRIRLIRLSVHQGLPAALNAAIAHSRGRIWRAWTPMMTAIRAGCSASMTFCSTIPAMHGSGAAAS